MQPWLWSDKVTIVLASIPVGSYVEQMLTRVPERRLGLLVERMRICQK